MPSRAIHHCRLAGTTETIFDRRSMTENRAIDRPRADDRYAVDGDSLLGALMPSQARRAARGAPRRYESMHAFRPRSKPLGKRSRSGGAEDRATLRNTLQNRDLRFHFDHRPKPCAASPKPWHTLIFPMPASAMVRRSPPPSTSRHVDTVTRQKRLGQGSQNGRRIAPLMVAHTWPSPDRSKACAERSQRHGKRPTTLPIITAAPRLPNAPSRARRLRKKIFFLRAERWTALR